MMAMAAAVATRAAEKGLQQLESVCGAWRGGYAVAAVWLAAIETVRLNSSPNPDKIACHEVSAGRNRRDLGLIEVAQRTRRRQHQAHLRASLWVACKRLKGSGCAWLGEGCSEPRLHVTSLKRCV